MGDRRLTGRLDFGALRRAIERGDPDSMLELYAQDARVRVLDGGAVSFEVEGKAEVAKYLRAVHARPAIHRVENEVVAEDRIRFEESCEYPDGARTVVATTLEVREGEISHQVDVVVSRDGSSGEPGQPAERDRDRPAPDGESPRGATGGRMMEFLVIAHDRTDDEALARRMVVRERHLAAARRTIESGNMLIGGAILDEEGRMVGSMTVVSFPDRTAFDHWLENVPYNKNGIWEKVEVYPYHVAVTASPPDDGGVRADRRHDQTMRKAT